MARPTRPNPDRVTLDHLHSLLHDVLNGQAYGHRLLHHIVAQNDALVELLIAHGSAEDAAKRAEIGARLDTQRTTLAAAIKAATPASDTPTG